MDKYLFITAMFSQLVWRSGTGDLITSYLTIYFNPPNLVQTTVRRRVGQRNENLE